MRKRTVVAAAPATREDGGMLERCAPVTLLLLLCGCSRGPANAATADTLVLELGGSNRPLQESMQRLGVKPKPPPEEAPQPSAPAPPDVPPPASQPKPAADVLEVKLEKGQTLYDLARKHLGSATRWREIAEFNHIDEARLNRLREGTLIRVPLRKN